MKVSTRNVFPGTITKVVKGAVNAEVHLATKGGDEIIASITNASVDHLGLEEGTSAMALVKASWVILGKDVKGKLSTRNLFTGTIAQVTPGAVNSEVTIKLSSGTSLTAIVTNTSVQNLKLAAGGEASAAFKASSVIIAVE
jgi:molybdate transport system regulatory protein